MSQQLVDIGVQGNDGTGDSIRESFRKVNENFTEIYAVFGAGGTINFTNLGDTPNSYAGNQIIMANALGTALTARDLQGGNGIVINKSSEDVVTISSTTQGLHADEAGTGLAGHLNANTFTIGNLAAPSQALVDSFNLAFAGLASTTIDDLAVTKGYADARYITTENGVIINAIKPRAQPAIPETTEADYDPTLTSNYLSTEAMQRKDVVYRGGDTMTGKLYLNDHPGALEGAGTPNGANDLQAATKYYVDNQTFTSNVNLFVSTSSGDDAQTKSPLGKEGRFWQYAYKTVGAAALQAENLINLASIEPGPYKQRIAYTVGPDQTFTTISSVELSGGNSGTAGYQDAADLLTANKAFIQSETIAYLNKKYVNYIPIDDVRYTKLVNDIVDGVTYDLVTGTDYHAITLASNLFEAKYADLSTEQLTQLADAVNHVKDTILDYSYSTTNTELYIGAVIDAICYDLVFEGSFQSLQVALAFPKYNTGLSVAEISATISNLGDTLLLLSSVTISPNAINSITDNIQLINNTIATGSATITSATYPEMPSTNPGLTSAKELLLNNVKFMQAELVAYLQANFPNVTYSKTTCQRDVEFIVWALIYDFMYEGNQRSVYAAMQYWLHGQYQIQTFEKEATVAAMTYLNTLAQAIIINTSPALVYQTSFRQYTNETINGGDAAAVSIDTNITTIVNIVNSSVLPTPTIVNPNVSIAASVLKTARNIILSGKTTYEAQAVTFINTNPDFSIVNNATVNGLITDSFDTMSSIITLGASSRSTPTYPNPAGISAGYVAARQALLANLDFIADECYEWSQVQVVPTFTPYDGTTNFKRRLKYIVEALAHDLTYGGNTASLDAASQYWSVNSESFLSSTEKTAMGLILAHLSNICVLITQNSAVSPTYSSTPQVTNPAFLDGLIAATEIGILVNDTIDIITTNATVAYIYPDLATYGLALRNARTVIVDNKAEIAANTIVYLKTTYRGGFNYNESTCYRDIGYIIDGMSIDILTGGNYQTVNAGKSYYKNASAKAVAIGTQFTETIDGINFAKELGLQVLAQSTGTRYQLLVPQVFYPSKHPAIGAVSTFSDNMDTVLSIITNGIGAAPAASFGTGIYTVTFSNGGNGYVDQGTPHAVHIIPGKVLAGATSGSNGSIVKYIPNFASSEDAIQVRLTRPGFFQVGEQLDFAETVKDLNITIFVESGIYYEDYPIRLPAQCSIKGDEFRRTIIRPLNRVSQSPWRKIFFYRDAIIDALEVGLIDTSTDYATNTTIALGGTTDKILITLGSGQAQSSWIGKVIQDNASPRPGKAVIDSISGNTMNCSVIYPFATKKTYSAGTWHLYGTLNYGRHYLTDPLDIESTAKNNRDIDVLLCNDATRVSNITFQGHGGFAMVLDPEGQIKTKSPYGQVCTSFSQSINSKSFRGGQYVDGFTGRVFGVITNIADDGITVTVTGSVNSGLDIRPPQAPCVFYVQGNRYQVNDIVSYDPGSYTVVVTLDVSTPFNPNNIYNAVTFATEVGLLVDELSYDLVFGSNYQSVKAGLTYLQPQNVKIGLQQLYLLSGIEKTRDLINSAITTPSSQINVTSNTAVTTGIITQGISAVPTLVYPVPVGTASTVANAKAILIANKEFIKTEVVSWIASNYSTKAIYQYNAVKTSRDIGYIVDALVYDLLYGGNSASWDVANWFWSGVTNEIIGQETYYAAALSHLQSILNDIVQNTPISISAGNLLSQNVSLSVASSAEGDTLKTLISTVIDFILDGQINNSVIGTTSSGSSTVNNVNYSPALVNGRTVTGIGIPNGTTIVSYTPATKVLVLTQNVNATNVNVTINVSGAVPSRTAPTLPSDSSYNTVKADRVAVQAAKAYIQDNVIIYLNEGAGLGINIEMGGNRSMLANDFAMINDLGYAIFCTNGGVSEQVSTFSYYCHTHYWANNGGQIRSVAGSNAHGDYGLRSSGYDVTELPDSVQLAYDMVQTARVYKQGLVASQMTPTTSTQALSIWILGYDYSPPNNAEIEIDHTLAGGIITRYLVSTIEHTTITIGGQNVLKLNLSTAGTNSTVTTGLSYELYDGQLITIRVNQSIKFNNIDNVRPTRPSTAVQYGENLADIYRIIAYSLVDSTGETLGNNVAILQSDASFNYYKFNSDGANITNVDPQDPTKTQGSKVGDNKIAVLQISIQSVIDQINKGIYLTGWAGRVHRIISYTPPTFIATGVVDTYQAVGSVYTLTVTNVAGTITPGMVVSGTGFAGYTGTVTNVVSSGSTSITSVVTLSSAATGAPAGTITFGVAANGFLTIDPNPVHNNAADGTAVTSMTYNSHTSGPSGTTYTQVKFDVPFSTTLPAVDSYLTVSNNANSAYNGTFQVADVVSETQITVGDTTGLSVGMVLSSGAVGAVIPQSCIIQSIDSISQFTVSPAAWVPGGSSVSATLVAYLSGLTITNGGTTYTNGAPIITITGGGATSSAIAVATVSGGAITAVNIISAGYGYTGLPDVTLSYGDAVLTPVLSQSPTVSTTVSAGNTTTQASLIYPTAPTVTTSATATETNVATLLTSSIAGTTLSVGTVTGGSIVVGMYLTGGTIPDGVYITGNISGTGNGSTWTVSKSVTQTSTTIVATENLVTLNSTTGITVGQHIKFSGTAFGGLVAGTTYYVTEVVGSTISISAGYDNTNLPLSSATGTMVAVASGFRVDTAIDVSSYTGKTGSGPYLVTLTLPLTTITQNAYYKVEGNTNKLYNGFWKCTATSNTSTTSITLQYPYDPGTWSTATVTTITKEVTSGTSTQLGISKPFSTGTAATLRLGYAGGSTAQITQRISTCRATGHDLLDVGTGSYTTTNWPTVIYGNPAKVYQQSQEVLEEGVGRVFYVTTDQNGIFRVGRFFTVDQGTGSVTFSASIALSNLDGLGFKRGVVVSEFSTDPSMTNNASDTVPVQSAIRSYIDKRLGLDHGGSPMALAGLIGPGYVALNGSLAMKGTLNLANYGIINVGNPTLNTDATNKQYVDGLVGSVSAIYKLSDTTITTPVTGNVLVYNAVTSKWINTSLSGDTVLSLNTGTGVLTATIQAGAVDNTKVSATAGIVQSKLSMTIAGTSSSSPTGTAAQIQAASGVSSFNSNVFTATNGWITLKTSTSSATGVTFEKIQHMSNGTLLGNRSGGAASPSEVTPQQVVSDAGGLVNSLFSANGVITVTYDGLNTANNTYSISNVTTTRGASSLVKTGSSGEVDVGFLKVGGYKALSLTGVGATLTSTFTTPGTFDYMTASGTTASNTTITTYGTFDTSNGTLKSNLITTDKVGAPSGPGAGSASISGWWAVQAASQIDFSLGKLKSTTLTTGADNINGTINGIWTLDGSSRLQATYADIAEYYEGDTDYEPGTVLVFGGDKEVTTTTLMNDTRSAGVVTTDPAYVMNQGQTGIRVCIALAGRVPCKVIGRVKKGDLLTTSATPGYAVKANDPKLGSIIGKALENKDYGEAGVIQVAVGRV